MAPQLELHNLEPEPQQEWRRMLRFAGWNEASLAAAARSAETLLARAHELVVGTYDYLLNVPETAEILGWEHGADQAHLEERRRFFTIWVARTIGMDTSDEFAMYLFRAGKFHAGHGPRHIHTPPGYVTASIGLVLASFARYMREAELGANVIAEAMDAWSRYLSVQSNQMAFGYRVAQALEKGPLDIPCTVYGRLRPLLGVQEIHVHAEPGAPVSDLLTKFFNYFPQVRDEALERVWQSSEEGPSLWTKVETRYAPRSGWRVLLNGRDVRYSGGLTLPVGEGDTLAIFPPGR
ncbi:MAG: protoglobin domain-containing protein [Anaerolineae bacterium]